MNIQYKDKTTFGVGSGWEFRTGKQVRGLIIHTTNGAKGSTYESEVNYLYTSRKVGAHYLIAKDGRITQFLNPLDHIAYHAGKTLNPAIYANAYSIGIECHYTPGEGAWTNAMIESLTELTRMLIQQYTIQEQNIETHRAVAIFDNGKLGRKIDPSGLTDVEFYLWRKRLYTKEELCLIAYRVNVPVANIRQSPQRNASNICGVVYKDDILYSSTSVEDENHENIDGTSTWIHITKGMSHGINIDNLGFVHRSVVVPIV